MAITVAQFVSSRPEFSSAGAQLVAEALTEARSKLDAGTWGNQYDNAVSALAAHLLWTSPFGVSMRLDGGSEESESRYLKELGRLQLARVPRIIVLR
jgi:hypothetical protein